MKNIDTSAFCGGGGNSEPLISKGYESRKSGLRKKFFAFTLAEVLITLGIIGVVAALTIPTLISNHQKKVYVTQLKKSVNTVSNGFRLLLAKEGVDNLEHTDFGIHLNHNAYYNEIGSDLKPYFNMIADRYMGGNDMVYKLIPNGTYNYGSCYFITLSDGSDICINNYGSSADSYVAVYIDVNGVNKLPNTAGLDFFKVEFTNNGVLAQLVDDGSALSRCTESHSGAPYECFIRVVKDNWEITYY